MKYPIYVTRNYRGYPTHIPLDNRLNYREWVGCYTVLPLNYWVVT